jgi:hypothetical protein
MLLPDSICLGVGTHDTTASKNLGHNDAVAFESRFELAHQRSRTRADLYVPETAIKRPQICAQAQEIDPDLPAGVIAQVIFGRFDHDAAKAGALPRRVDGQHAEISN